MGRLRAGAALGALAAVASLTPVAAVGQGVPSVSRPVVQQIPGADSQRLNAAQARLARDSRDVPALIEAGDAARVIGDFDAALGFYRRADEVQPDNPRIKAALGSAFVLNGDPVSALPQFADAERLGATPAMIGADRGLAYDLVGDNASAQRIYQAALVGTTGEPNDSARMRLAVSQAIAGNLATSQTTLMPLLSKQDKPAWRTRAFTLAIAGETSDAVITAEKILPPQLAQGIAPYLRYMPKLTRAQQAAAANLGRFPKAAEIGQDDPRIAAYAPPRLASADTGLIPRGAPLDAAKPATAATAKTKGRKPRVLASVTPSAPASSRFAAARTKTSSSSSGLTSTRGTDGRDLVRSAPPEPKPAIETSGELPPLAGQSAPRAGTLAASPPRSSALASTSPAEPSAPDSATSSAGAGLQLPRTSAPTTTSTYTPIPPRPTPAPSTTPAASSLAAAPAAAVRTQQGFGLSSEPGRTTATQAPTTAPFTAGATTPNPSAPRTTTAPVASPAISAGTPAMPERSISLAEIFADLGKPVTAVAPAAGAVDLRTLPPPRVVAKEPESRVVLPDVSAAAKPGATREPATPAPRSGASAKKDAKAATAEKAKAKKPVPPPHPSRFWVQVGVGRDKAAIAFDWRRYGKQAPALFKGRTAYVSEMGRTNRILAGPFDSIRAANAFVADLKKAGFEGALPWTSTAGQAVDPLTGA